MIGRNVASPCRSFSLMLKMHHREHRTEDGRHNGQERNSPIIFNGFLYDCCLVVAESPYNANGICWELAGENRAQLAPYRLLWSHQRSTSPLGISMPIVSHKYLIRHIGSNMLNASIRYPPGAFRSLTGACTEIVSLQKVTVFDSTNHAVDAGTKQTVISVNLTCPAII